MRRRQPTITVEVIRILAGLAYLAGAAINALYTLTRPEMSSWWADNTRFDVVRRTLLRLALPHATTVTTLIIVLGVACGLALLARGTWVTAGNVVAAALNFAMAPLSGPQLVVNVALAVFHLWLATFTFDRDVLEGLGLARISRVVDALVDACAIAITVPLSPLLRRFYAQWGARAGELYRPFPGDDRVPSPQLASTMALTIRAPAQRVWPHLLGTDGYIADTIDTPHLVMSSPTDRSREASLVFVIEPCEEGVRLVTRHRARFQGALAFLVGRLLRDPIRFVQMRRTLLTIRRQAERALRTEAAADLEMQS